jgi:DNA processing protein
MDKRGLLDLIIARLPCLSVRDKVCLCDTFETEGDLINKTKSDIENILGHRLAAFWDIESIRLTAEQDERTVRLRGLNWVSWIQPAYPPLLREIYDPPAVLFYRGSLPNPEKPLAAIVGTRRPSPQAAAQTYDISRDLGQHGISVVSGLALGIDAMAHRGNMEGGGVTFAILGSGADEVYPRANRVLARRVLETGGGLISEYPPGTGPFKWNFPARNRIISGIARGVLIAEAPESSGALITAGFAAEQNRDLWVASTGIAVSPYDRRGTMKLADNGSRVISGARDILKEWNMEIKDNCAGGERPGDTEYGEGKALAEKLARSLNIDLQG